MSEKNREFSARSVEEAIEKGLAELGMARNAVKIQVVREGSRGILGLGSEDAIVRLTPAATPPVGDVRPPTADRRPPMEVSEPPTPEPDGAPPLAKEILGTLLRDMGLLAQVEVLPDLTSDDNRAFVLNILGEDLGVLIGRRGETLRDLEYVTRLMVAQKIGKPAKLLVDVGGYRTLRERVLRELAKRMAERVQANRQPITLEAMPPNERRIVHITLRDHPIVKTHSIGEGDHRRVMILPK